jgi:hypothetical protein
MVADFESRQDQRAAPHQRSSSPCGSQRVAEPAHDHQEAATRSQPSMIQRLRALGRSSGRPEYRIGTVKSIIEGRAERGQR